MPYEDKKLTVTPNDILNNLIESDGVVENREDYEFIAAGIDWGAIHWLTVMGIKANGQKDILNLVPIQKPSMTDVDAVGKDIEQIKLALRPYDPDIIVADVGDSGDKITQLMREYGTDKVFGCRYKSSPRSTGQIIPSWSEKGNLVTVDKLMQNKRVIAMIKEGRIAYFNDPDNKELQRYIMHWGNVVIRDEEDENTKELYQTIGRKGDD